MVFNMMVKCVSHRIRLKLLSGCVSAWHVVNIPVLLLLFCGNAQLLEPGIYLCGPEVSE